MSIPTGFCGVGSSGGGNGDGDGQPEYFGPAFGPNSTPSPSGDDSSNSDGDNNSDFWSDISDIVFGEPASAAEPPEIALIPPGNTDRDRRAGDRDRRSTEREIWLQEQQDRFERGLQETWEFIKDVNDYLVDETMDVQQDADDLQDRIDRFIKGEDLEYDTTQGDIPDLDISDNTGDYSPRDFLDGDRYEFPNDGNTRRIEPTRDFTDDFSDLPSTVFDSQNSGGTWKWRGETTIQDGNSRGGWEHIRDRHITGNHPSTKPTALFPPGTTRRQLQETANRVVKDGKLITESTRATQTFERKVKVNGKRMTVRVVVDQNNGNVVTIFPVFGTQ